MFDDAISCILLSKNFLLVSCTVDLYSFQLWMSSCSQYLLRLLVHFWFHHSLECFVTCLHLECWHHASSNIAASWLTMFWRSSLPLIEKTSRFSTPCISDLMKFFSSLLFFLIDRMLISTFISLMPTSMMRGTWSNSFCNSECRECWPNPKLLGERKTRSKTELVSYGLLAYLVGPGLNRGKAPTLSYQWL